MKAVPLVVVVLVGATFVVLVLLGTILNSPVRNQATTASAEQASTQSKAVIQCPNGGIYAPLSGACKNLPRAGVLGNSSGCPSTFVGSYQCYHFNKWSVSKQALPSHTLSMNMDDVNMFSLNVAKTSTGNVLSSSFKLTLLNDGSCNAKLASLIVALDQSLESSTTGNSYGPSGKNFKLWATSGTENPLTAGLCQTPGKAQICSSTCNVTVPYDENTIMNLDTNGPLDLSTVIVPANSNCTLNPAMLNVGVNFVVPDTLLAQMRNSPNNYRLNVMVTFDACCDRGSSCGIDIDCDRTVNTVNTVQLRSGFFAIPSICTEKCNSVRITDQLLSVSSDSTDPDCSSTASINNPYPFPTVLTSGTNIMITGDEACDTSSCDCSGTGKYQVSLSNKAYLTPDIDSCINPITGTSLLTVSSMTAIHDYFCSYPIPRDCQVSDWAEWTPTSTCNDDSCHFTSMRSRTIDIQPCHGGLACPTLTESKTEPCSTPCTYAQYEPNCRDTECVPNTCQASHVCTTQADKMGYCDNGIKKTCAEKVETNLVNCSTPACTYSAEPVCEVQIPCNYPSCTEQRVCSRTANKPEYCLNGNHILCPAEVTSETVACTVPCSYTTWAEWSAYSECDCIAGTQTRIRTRAAEAVCPSSAMNTCEDTISVDSRACSCPAPTPTPITVGCLADHDCVNQNNLCLQSRCESGACIHMGELTCTQPMDKCQFSSCNRNTGSCDVHPIYCNDNNACTTDYCNATTGSCEFSNRTFSGKVLACTEAVCDPQTGNFTVQTKVCPDGQFCNGNDPEQLCRSPCISDSNCTFLNPSGSKCIETYCNSGTCLTRNKFCDYTQSRCDPEFGCVKTCGLLVCLPGFIKNLTDCTCIPNPVCDPNIVCPDPYTFDNTTCTCKCQKTCEIGQYLEYGGCSCQCNAASCDALSNNCIQRSCNPYTRQCDIINSTLCDDGNACTNEPYATCAESPVGYCQHITTVSVGEICFLGGCDPITGPYSLPVDCSDGTNLTIDYCNDNILTSNILGCINDPINCNDNDICTKDTVDMTTLTCKHEHISDCCRTDNDCSSTEKCTLQPLLGYSVCQVNTDIKIVECLAATACTNTKQCTNSSACDFHETCSNGWCTSLCENHNSSCSLYGICVGGQHGCCKGANTCGFNDGCLKSQCTSTGCQKVPDNSACSNYSSFGVTGVCNANVARIVDGVLIDEPCGGNHCAKCQKSYSQSGQLSYIGCTCAEN